MRHFCSLHKVCLQNLKSMYYYKMHNFSLNLKIFLGYIEQSFRHLHVKYLSDWTILKFLHKLQSYMNLAHLGGLQRMFT